MKTMTKLTMLAFVLSIGVQSFAQCDLSYILQRNQWCQDGSIIFFTNYHQNASYKWTLTMGSRSWTKHVNSNQVYFTMEDLGDFFTGDFSIKVTSYCKLDKTSDTTSSTGSLCPSRGKAESSIATSHLSFPANVLNPLFQSVTGQMKHLADEPGPHDLVNTTANAQIYTLVRKWGDAEVHTSEIVLEAGEVHYLELGEAEELFVFSDGDFFLSADKDHLETR